MIRFATSLTDTLDRAASAVMPTLARLLFLGVLFFYFWGSAMTKLGEGVSGLWTLSFGAYAQIFPKPFEALGYDASALPAAYKLIALAGTWSEIALPVLIVIGLFTRLAALGLTGFVLVQSWVDIYGHNLAKADIGAWFDNTATALIFDQRAFWIFVFLYLVMRGAGPVSLDARLFARAPYS